jgi:hypothetical protein
VQRIDEIVRKHISVLTQRLDGVCILRLDSLQEVSQVWRSIKYEEVYLHAYDSVAAAKAGIGRYFAFYNAERPHTALDRNTPDKV